MEVVMQNGKGSKRRPCVVSRKEAEQNWDRIFPKANMKLYRIKDETTGKFYRHKYSQFRGGDWVNAKDATIWTKPGGANGALGAVREKCKKGCFVIESAVIAPSQLNWQTR